MDLQKELVKDFVSSEHKRFKFRLGKALASSLSGFIAGIIVTVIFFLTLFDIVLK